MIGPWEQYFAEATELNYGQSELVLKVMEEAGVDVADVLQKVYRSGIGGSPKVPEQGLGRGYADIRTRDQRMAAMGLKPDGLRGGWRDGCDDEAARLARLAGVAGVAKAKEAMLEARSKVQEAEHRLNMSQEDDKTTFRATLKDGVEVVVHVYDGRN